jgi:hypothetical protein
MLPIVPHELIAGADCCGCLIVIERGDQADLRCNECDALVATVRAAEAEATLLAMAMAQGVCSAACPHCGAHNVFIGFTQMEAFVCRECGLGVTIPTPVQ